MACRRESGFKDTKFWWIVGLSFFLFLEKKEAKIQGRHHRSRRTKRTLPRHVGRTLRAQSSEG